MADLFPWPHFDFAWWGCFLLLPLPWVVRKLLPEHVASPPIRLAYLPPHFQRQLPTKGMQKACTIIIWLALIVACARPVWYGDPIEYQQKYRDIMLVVDLSGSMQTKDMRSQDDYIDRLTAVKKVLGHFIEQRLGDRLGLILFADHAYLQTPLTADRQSVLSQLKQTVIGLVGQQTAIGDGIGLATKTFVDSKAPQRIMILLSDGSNNAGVLDPIEAAKIAKHYHTTIYTVGVGAGEMLVKNFFMTQKVNTAKDLDEKTLTTIAQSTGGQYFRARNAEDLQNIYNTINKLEPISHDTQIWRPQQEWFMYPLAVAFLFSLGLFVLRRKHG